MKKLCTFFLALLVLCSTFLFSACKDDEVEELSFTRVSDFLTIEDTAFREFSAALKAKNINHGDYELLENTTDYIEKLTSNLSIQLDEYQTTLVNVANLSGDSDVSITKSTEKISIVTNTQSLEANMNEEKTKMNIIFSSSETFYVLEVVKMEESYMVQMAYKEAGENYTIYRYKFCGTVGTLAINYGTTFDAIYNKELNYNNYPGGGEVSFSS